MTMRGKNRNACAIIFLFCWFWWPWKRHYFFIEIIRFFKWCCRCYKLLNLLIICWSFPSQNCECCCNCKNSQLLTIELRSRVELQIYVDILWEFSFLWTVKWCFECWKQQEHSWLLKLLTVEFRSRVELHLTRGSSPLLRQHFPPSRQTLFRHLHLPEAT